MKLLVVTHKPIWASDSSPSGYVTDGGFPLQLRVISELFDSTVVAVPCYPIGRKKDGIFINGKNLSVLSLRHPRGFGIWRKLSLFVWLLQDGKSLIKAIRDADSVYAAIPGDIGTIGFLFAHFLGKPLLVRHCGNWFKPLTAAEHFWKWYMEHFAGGKRVMFATGDFHQPPSTINPHLAWIFSTSLSEEKFVTIRRIRKYPQEGLPTKLIIACRQEELKGVGILIRSLPHVLLKRPNISLDIVGDGNALPTFRKLAEDLGLTSIVRFHGYVKHDCVIDLLGEAHLFCFPTLSEGFPKAALEAMVCGLPVVATNVSVLPNLLKGCGIIVEKPNPKDIGSAILTCLNPNDA